MNNSNDHSEVSWGDVLQDDALVWLPHALCRHADKLELTFDDIGFIAQCFSFRGKTGIHPSESTLAIRGGYNTRNPIINRFKRLEEMNLINRHRIRHKDGTFGTYRYDFSPLREKLEQLVKAEWASGDRKPKQRSDSKESIHVDDDHAGEHQHDERQQKKLKGLETQGFRNSNTKNHLSAPDVLEDPDGKTPAKKDDSGKSEAKDSNNPSQTSLGVPRSDNSLPPRCDSHAVQCERLPLEKPFPPEHTLYFAPPEHTLYFAAIDDCLSSFNIGMELILDTVKVPNFRTATDWWRKYPVECMRDGIAATVANAEKSNFDINFKPLKYFEPEVIKAFEKYTENLKAKESAKRLKLATDERNAERRAEQKKWKEEKIELPRTFAEAMAANGGST